MKRREFLARSALVAVGLRCEGARAAERRPLLTIVHSCAPGIGWRLGAKDLDRYLSRVGVRTSVHIPTPPTRLPSGSLLVLVDRADPMMVQLRNRYPIGEPVVEAESFSITTFARDDDPGQLIYFLESADTTGAQFACYEYLERFAGIRFLHPDFEHVPPFTGTPKRIDTGVVRPGFAVRGLYPWNYNYNKRGLTTFCDINARFVANDWAWFARLGDWLIKNKQNTFFWFDDVFDDNPLSASFPKSLAAHWRERGLRQVLGLGWASNEGRPRGGRWEGLTCVDANGKSIEDAEWRTALCPQVPEYTALADRNIADVDFDKPEAIGALIGYGENSWAAHQKSKCIRHANTPADVIMKRDLAHVRDRMSRRGAAKMPLGFVISTHSAQDDSPFSGGDVIEALPDNGLVSMHIYQQDSWSNFSDILQKIRQRNAREKSNVKAIPIAEVAFICNYDIPLFRPSILRRREAHMRSFPRDDALGHLTTLNTTQYLYWLKSYQLMRWQWHTPKTSWGDEMAALGVDLFGAGNGELFTDLVGRYAALDHLRPTSEAKELMQSSDELAKPVQWTRYAAEHHSDDFGFFLWSKGHDEDALREAEQNVAACLRLNAELAASAGPLYRSRFFDTLALTAHYHAIRIHCGRADLAMAAASTCKGDACDRHIAAALAKLEQAQSSLGAYDRHLGKVVETTSAVSRASLKQDFVLNPSEAFLDSRMAALRGALKNGIAPFEH